MEKVEFLILRNLLHNEEYIRKVIPFIKSEYFEDQNQRIVFDEILSFVQEYNQPATKEVLCIEVEKRTDINEQSFKEIVHLISCLESVPTEFQWLVNTTEKWCRDRAIYIALMESIHIVEFDLEYFNKITKGGLPNKTLNIALAGTGVGKSLFMCHVASSVLLQGRNVLYITLEMAEERIAERIDANLLNVPIQDITNLSKQMFENKVTNLSKKTQGTLIIKEYPTASAHSGHFKSLLNELSLKKSFKPDIIFVDYLNICASSRYKGNSNINSYTFVKAIAEELRGLAVEFNVPIVSATQTTRSGYGSSDVELTDTSESFGLPATADLMFALISTEDLEGLGQILVKQLKNRYNDPTIHKRFVVGIDRAKMRLYDCEQSAQQDILDNGKDEEYDYEEKKPKKSFEGFKF